MVNKPEQNCPILKILPKWQIFAKTGHTAYCCPYLETPPESVQRDCRPHQHDDVTSWNQDYAGFEIMVTQVLKSLVSSNWDQGKRGAGIKDKKFWYHG